MSYILHPIVKSINDIIWITPLKTTNELIRQPLTSAMANSDLDPWGENPRRGSIQREKVQNLTAVNRWFHVVKLPTHADGFDCFRQHQFLRFLYFSHSSIIDYNFVGGHKIKQLLWLLPDLCTSVLGTNISPSLHSWTKAMLYLYWFLTQRYDILLHTLSKWPNVSFAYSNEKRLHYGNDHHNRMRAWRSGTKTKT